MTWVKLDDTFPTNQKVDALTADAFRLYVEALCHCAANLTDGQVTRTALRRLWDGDPAELVDAGLWTASEDGYVVNDYLEFNPSRAEVLEQRKRRSEAGRKGADARWHGKSDGKSHSTSYSDRNAPDPTRPLDKTRSPVDNSRPRLRAVGELRTDESDGSPVPSTSPAVQEALRAARQRKGET